MGGLCLFGDNVDVAFGGDLCARLCIVLIARAFRFVVVSLLVLGVCLVG